ncbi:MAG: AbrB/MazE/SpoVT family DNA-binding domain-containing protein [Nanoarchaeota archaeon]|nr:AbrB/MazE/SpoVT family DNA-binding domain-containing protein [Nanoarchaeota archaeon]
MKRKIIKQGHNTLTLTLPTEWVKKLNLKAGDEIDLIERDSSLVINGHQNMPEKIAEIDITNFTIPLLWRFFQSAYRAGSDEIKIKFDSNKKDYKDAYHFYTTQFDYSKLGEKVPSKPALAMIQGMVDRFIGMGIIETGKDYCIVKEMGEPTVKEFENSMRRVFLVILQMFERVIEAIDKNEINDSNLCKEIHTIDLNVDRFVDYCCRILKKLSASFPEGKKRLLFSTLFILELVGDEFKYIGKHLAISKKPVKDVLPLIEMVKKHFEMYYNLFYKFSRENAIELGENDYKIYNEHFKMKEKLKDQSKSIETHFMMISKFVLVLTELRIEMEF